LDTNEERTRLGLVYDGLKQSPSLRRQVFGIPKDRWIEQIQGDATKAEGLFNTLHESGEIPDTASLNDFLGKIGHKSVAAEEPPTKVFFPVPRQQPNPTYDAIPGLKPPPTLNTEVVEPKEPGFIEKYIKQPISDFAGSFNRSTLKAPSAMVKTASELGTGVGNALGMDLKVEDDVAYQLADKYDKWIDDSEFGREFIGDKTVSSLAGDVGSGAGQIASMLVGGGQAKTVGGLVKGALGLKATEKIASNPKLIQAVSGKFLNPQTAIAFGQVFNSEYEGMKQAGESDKTAFKQALINGLAMAPLENIPLANLASRMEKAVGAPIAKRILNGLLQGGEEGTQEGFQQLLSNLSNNQLVEIEDNVKDWSDGIERSSDAGAIVGLILGTIAGVKGRRGPTKLGGIPTEPVPDGQPIEPETPPEVQRQTDEEILAGQQRAGFVPPSPLQGYSQEAKNLIQSAQQGKMVSMEPVKALMDQIYQDYQIFTEQKNSTARNLTISQIEAGQAEMEAALDVLGDYVSKRDGGEFMAEFAAKFQKPEVVEREASAIKEDQAVEEVPAQEQITPITPETEVNIPAQELEETTTIAEDEQSTPTPLPQQTNPEPNGTDGLSAEVVAQEPIVDTEGVEGVGEPIVRENDVPLTKEEVKTEKGEPQKAVAQISDVGLKSSEGEVNTGKIEEATLPDEGVNKVIANDTDGNPIKVQINSKKLKGTLLSRNGKVLFRAMQGRFFALAKVGKFYVPFYISSSGTSGKNEGEWYPFFGYNNWLVKGRVGKGGEMDYSPEIDRVTKLLNENLQIPAKYFTQFGQVIGGGTPVAPTKVYYDINDDIGYESWFTEFDRKDGNKYTEDQFVADRTGLNPNKVVNDGEGSADAWIKSIIKLTEIGNPNAPTQPTPKTPPIKESAAPVVKEEKRGWMKTKIEWGKDKAKKIASGYKKILDEGLLDDDPDVKEARLQDVERLINDEKEWIRIAESTSISGSHKYDVENALASGQYQKAITDGSMTAKKAVEIIEDAGVKAPKDIVDLVKPKGEPAQPTPKTPPIKESAAPVGKEAPKSNTDKAIDYLQSLLDETDNAAGLNAEFYRTAIKGMIAAIKAGKTVANAISEAIDYLVGKGENRDEVVAALEKHRKPLEALVPPSASEPQGETKERKTITSIKEANDISEDVKDALGGERTKYEVLPNEVSVKEAKAIVDAMGLDAAKDLVLTPNSKIPAAFRTTVAQMLIKAYNANGQFKEAVDVAEGIAGLATNWGQGIQALSMFQFLTPEGQLLAAQREIGRQRDKKFKTHKTQIKKLKKVAEDVNAEAIDEAIDKVQGRIESRNPPTPRLPKEYGATNKLFKQSELAAKRKALRERSYSGVPPELVWLAGYHVEAGARSFADFAKAMAKEAGAKVKPHLRSLYKQAQKQVGGEGYSSDAEVAEHFANRVDKDIKTAMREAGIDINKIIKAHYTEADAAKETLTKKLVEKAGLDEKDAAIIAKAVEVEFNKIATLKKQKALAKAMGPLQRRTAKGKALQDKIIELSNIGAFTDETFKDAYAEAMGFPKLTPENAATIKKLAERVHNAKEGLHKQRATEDLLKYQAQIKGSSLSDVGLAIWMSAMLSGPTTQIKNTVANMANLSAITAIAATRNPRSIPGYMSAIGRGFVKGALEGVDVMKTGYSPIKDKAQIPGVLERMTFGGGKYNPFNYYKYVRRAMVAADVIVFEALHEARAYQLAMIQGKTPKEALKILNHNDDTIAQAKNEAQQEYDEIKANIEANTELSPFEKRSQLSQAKLDQKRRVYEIMDQKRPEGIRSEAHSFAEKGTFNHAPTGVLGFFAGLINKAAAQYPAVRLVVPFTNVVTNVTNEMLNYTPLGAVRSMKPDSGSTEQERIDMAYKAAIGAVATVTAFALSQPGDDDEEPLIQITANGYDDFAKNEDLKQTGWQPFSIKVGDRWYSYQYTPLMLSLAPVGALRDYEKYRKGKLDDSAMTKASFMLAQSARTAMKTTGYLESANGFLSAMLDNTDAGQVGDKLAKWTAKNSSAAVPVIGTNLYSQLADNLRKYQDIPDKEFRGTYFGRFLRNIPVARDQYQNTVNGLGEELPRVSPTIISDEPGPNEKLWNLLVKNKQNTGIEGPKGVTIVEGETERFLTQEEYYKFAKIRGAYIKSEMEDEYEDLKEMDEKEFAERMKEIKKEATQEAKSEIEP